MATKLQDTFTDTTGTSITSHTMDTGPGWTVDNAGTWQINSNQCKLVTHGGANVAGDVIYADAGVSDGIVNVDMIVNSSDTQTFGAMCRYQNANNAGALVAYNRNLASFRLFELASSTFTLRASSSVTLANGAAATISATFTGTSVTATINGGNSISYSALSVNTTGTKWGLRGLTAGELFDNFSVTTSGNRPMPIIVFLPPLHPAVFE